MTSFILIQLGVSSTSLIYFISFGGEGNLSSYFFHILLLHCHLFHFFCDSNFMYIESFLYVLCISYVTLCILQPFVLLQSEYFIIWLNTKSSDNYWFIIQLTSTLFHVQFSSVQFSRSVMSDSLRPHEPLHARPPCPSPTPGVHPNPCPLSRWCHPNILSSVVPFSSCPQSFPASKSFPMSQLFASGGQSIGVSASTSVFPVNTQDWFTLGWTAWISLQSKGFSRVFSSTTVQKHQFFNTQLSL